MIEGGQKKSLNVIRMECIAVNIEIVRLGNG